jgi:hypothetical protein
VEGFISEIDMSVKCNLEIQELNITCMFVRHAPGVTAVVNEVTVT